MAGNSRPFSPPRGADTPKGKERATTTTTQLLYYSNKVLNLGIPKFRCTWARYSFVANRQYSPFRVVPRGRLVCIARGTDIDLTRLFAKIQTFVTEE